MKQGQNGNVGQKTREEVSWSDHQQRLLGQEKVDRSIAWNFSTYFLKVYLSMMFWLILQGKEDEITVSWIVGPRGS